jgi:hypothetical protein
LTTSLGSNFRIRSAVSGGFVTHIRIFPGSNETYLDSGDVRVANRLHINEDLRLNGELRMVGKNIVNPYGIYLNNGGSFYTTSLGATRFDVNNSGILQFRVGETQKFRIDSSRNYMNQLLNMQGHSIVESPSISDARMKDIYGIRNDNDLERLVKIEYVNFRWKDPEFGGEDLGFIAQQVQDIAPEIITETANGLLGYNQQTYLNFIGHAVQQLALKEANTNKIASQALQATETNTQKIERLEKRIEELEGAA